MNNSVFEKYTTNSDSSSSDTCSVYSNKSIVNNNGKIMNTDMKVNILLSDIKKQYSDKESLRDMLDETLILLKKQQDDNDILRVRCREYEKAIAKKHDVVQNLVAEIDKRGKYIEHLEEKIETLENFVKKQFFSNYIEK